MDKDLGSEDIASVNKHIRRAKAQAKWEQIGLGLGLSSATINGIREGSSRDDQRLYSTLNAWVNGKDKVQTTWRVLIRTLQSEDINESALANTIMAEKGLEPLAKRVQRPLMLPAIATREEEPGQRTSATNSDIMDKDPGKILLDVNDLDLLHDLVKEDSSNWYKIGLKLRFGVGELEEIKAMPTLIVRGPVGYSMELLHRWLKRGSHAQPLYLQDLAEAISRADNRRLGAQLVEKYLIARKETKAITGGHGVQNEKLKDYLRAYYRKCTQHAKNDWPPSLDVEYIDLVMIKQSQLKTYTDQLQREMKLTSMGEIQRVLTELQRENLKLTDITDYPQNRKVIIVEGAPGVGKTTLALKLCKDWADDRLLTEFSLVFYIPLHVVPRLRVAECVDDLMEYLVEDHSPADLQAVKGKQGEGILFVLDGWDELPRSCQDEDMFFPKLIRGKSLPKCSVIVTSRPGVTTNIVRHANRFIEILGFSEDQMKQYIHSYIGKFTGDPTSSAHYAAKLIDDLEEYPNVASTCYIAINLTIACYVYCVSNYQFPPTLTEVYELFIVHAVKRHFSCRGSQDKAPVHEASRVTEFDDRVKAVLNSLGKLAFRGLIKNELSFTKKQMAEICQVDEIQASDGFGLLKNFNVHRTYGTQKLFQFLHLTIQEYLAAYSIMQMGEEEQSKYLDSILRDERFSTVLKFFCGMNKFSSSPCQRVFSRYIATPMVLECIFEGQWEGGCQQVAQILSSTLCEWHKIQPYRSLVYGYVMTKSGTQWTLKRYSCEISEGEVKSLCRYLLPAPRTLCCLHIENANITPGAAPYLKQIIQSQVWLSQLSFINAHMTDVTLRSICEALHDHGALKDRELLKQLDLPRYRSESATRTTPQEVSHQSSYSDPQVVNVSMRLSQENTDYCIITVGSDRYDYGAVPTEYPLDQPRPLEEDSDTDHELDQKHLEEAMKEGYVNASFLKVIFTGAAGAGKTHAFNLLCGADPPDPNYRQSTDCAKKAVTLRVNTAKDEGWEILDLEKRQKIIAKNIAALENAKIEKQQQPAPTQPQPEPEVALKPEPEVDLQPEPTAELVAQQQLEVDSEPKPKAEGTAQPHPEVDPKPPQLEIQEEQQSQSMTTQVPLETELDLLKMIREAVMSGEVSGEVLGTKWVYAVDTGGQPPFHELLSAFIKGASVCAFVFKLSENLDHRPLVEYWVDGTEVGTPYKHPLSNRQILEQSLQTIQALPSLSNEQSSPLLFVIGTHRDEQDKCTEETLEDKERILRDIMEQSGCNFQYNPHSGVERVVFDVNAKNPEEEDKTIASLLRGVIADKMPEPKEIPLRYYGLELELEHLASTKGVISMEECRAIGDRLSFNEKGLKAALRFLHSLNTLLYYPEVKEVKELIFCDPLVLIKIVSMVVAKIHQIKHQLVRATKEWRDSCERGLITIEQLNTEEFRSCFRSDIFTPNNLFKLFEHLLIVAKVNEEDHQFFMPCLLDDATEINRPHSEHCSPLIFKFHKKGKPVYAPSGLFSALVAFLLSFKNGNCCWMIEAEAESGGNVSRNIIKFHSRSPSANITLINFRTSFEVFVVCRLDYLHKYLPEIRKIMLKGLKEAKKVRNFEHVDYNEAFTCKCSKAKTRRHLAEIDIKEETWSCPHNPMEGGPLETSELVWYGVCTAIPQIIQEPSNQENFTPGSDVEFVVKAAGINLSYTWHHQMSEYPLSSEKKVIGNHQTLHIDKVKSCDEGYYVCTICSPTGGSVETKPAHLTTIPQISEEPDSLESVIPGKPAEFAVKAIGKNLTYTWHRQTAEQLLTSDKKVLVGNTQILRIDKVESNDEGYYVCTICNPTGGRVETKPAQLTTIPQITEEPDSLENATPGKPAEFVVKAIGKNLTYTWHRQTAEQLLTSDKKVLVGNTQILRIDKVKSNDEGYYVCTICNPTGGRVETKPAQLTTIPQITEEPDSLENATPGKPAEFVVEAIGKNLTYTWHRQTAEQLLPSDKRVPVGNTQILCIDKVESNDEGYYVCTICNPTGGSVETKPAQLTTIPQIAKEPDSLENAIPGKPAEFAVKAIGKNLTYTWHRQTSKQLLPSDKRVPVGDTQILRIDKVESNDEGYYVCTICNPTGGRVETKPAQLTTIPQITEEPDSLENAIPGKPAEFAVKAIGKNLTYTWHRQTSKQLLPSDKRVLVGNTQILRIDKVESNDEGYYVCTVCNPTGGRVETKPAQLTTFPQITEKPDSLENVTPGKPAEFTVKAIGKNLTYIWHRQTAEQLLPSDKKVLVGNTQILHIDKVESNNEGYYVCTICNPTGGSVETKPAQLTTIPQITEEPDSLENATPGKPAEFAVKAIGKNLTYTWHRQTSKQLLPSDKRVLVGNTQILRIDKVESNDEGYYVCTICNPTGGSVETKPVQLTTRTAVCRKYRCPIVVLVIAVMIAMAGGLGLSVWLPWQSNTATGFQTPGQPEATSGTVTQAVQDFNCHRIESSLDLFEELEDIADWEMLCYKLRVSVGKIGSIKHTYHPDIAHKKKECLDAFYKQGGGCWEDVVIVVSGYPFENKRLAKEIADRHGVEYSVE